MKNVNFRRAAQKTEGRAAKKGGAAGCGKGRAGLQKKGSPPLRPFLQPSLMCSPPARLNVQSTFPSCSAACRQPLENPCFSFGNTAPQPAGLPFSAIPNAQPTGPP